MQKAIREAWVNRFDMVEFDVQLKQLLATLERENHSVKSIIARLSETTTGSPTVR
jgi:hypothetical protein